MAWKDQIDLNRFANEADLLAFVQLHSPYLSTLIRRYPESLEELSERSFADAIASLARECSELPHDLSEAEVMTALRVNKAKAHLVVALGDIGGVFSLDQTVGALSEIAQATVSAAVDWLLRDAARRGDISLADQDHPQTDSGLVILGMGKLGAYELNYSSDIDLIVFFEPNAKGLTFSDPIDAVQVLSKLVRRLVRLMQERTADGYVFRTDIRLRPDPGAMPLAIPVDMALQYYESRGQNWERAAMIKARPIAGDFDAAERFLSQLAPFIWRKYMDYAAIADVQAIKRQIHAHKGHGKITVHGHNIKLGRGGIREIEFFVQTQQLIAGGRAPHLRQRGTRDMLATFAHDGWIENEVREDLDKAYEYLRRVEHVIQMRNDEQTHLVPDNDGGLNAVAALLGHKDKDAFSVKLRSTLETVEAHFAQLFREGETLSALHGNLVFTGETADPDTVDTLAGLGFDRPKDMWHIISGWHFGRYAAVQSERARERLTELTPALLEAFAQAPQPDDAIIKFDTFIKGLPAGVQLFSMLHANPELLRLLGRIITSAPRLSAIITSRPSVFAGLTEPAFFDRIAPAYEIENALVGILHDADGYEAVLDRLRIFASEQRFRIGTRLLSGTDAAIETGKALTLVSEKCIGVAMEQAAQEVGFKHGGFADGKWCVVALGRLGSREMTAGSDVDLIVLYDGVDALAESDGDKPLAASAYFARLTQRLIAALSAPTAEGVLYEVDMRLRPSGNKGPLATSLTAFERYQREEAWTWEHQALTRARPICGDADLCANGRHVINSILHADRDREKVRTDVLSMRSRLMREKPPRGDFDLKNINGGLTDIDFLSQFMFLTTLRNLKLDGAGARDTLAVLGNDVFGSELNDKLMSAQADFSTVLHLSRLCTSHGHDPAQLPRGLVEIICQALSEPSLGHVQDRLVSHRQVVADAFRNHVGVIAD